MGWFVRAPGGVVLCPNKDFDTEVLGELVYDLICVLVMGVVHIVVLPVMDAISLVIFERG